MTTRDAEMDATKEKSGEVESKGPLSSLVELQFRTMECGCQAILYMTGAKTNKIMRLSKLEATCGLSPGCKPPSQSSDDPPQTRSTWSSRSPIPQGSAVESWSRGDNALSVVIRSLVGGRRIGHFRGKEGDEGCRENDPGARCPQFRLLGRDFDNMRDGADRG